jgi:hypothetical protein
MQSTAPLPNGPRDHLDLELYRGRRFERPLVLIGAPLPRDWPADHSALTHIASQIRVTDYVWSNERQLFFLLPEVDRADAESFLDRLENLGVAERRTASIAVFPDDGLTKDALVAAATVFDEEPFSLVSSLVERRAERSRRGLRRLVGVAAAVTSSPVRGSAEEA